MKLQTTTIESTRYIAIGDQTLNFSCEGDFFLSVGDQHFINPKSHTFKDQDKFTVESEHPVYVEDSVPCYDSNQ